MRTAPRSPVRTAAPAVGRSGKAVVWIALLLVVAAVVAAVLTRGGGPAVDDSPRVLARERASAYFDEDLFTDAREALAPLLADADVDPKDLLRAVNVELAAQEFERAAELLDRAERLAPDDPTVPWSRFRIARDEGRLEDALGHVRRAVELASDDYPTKLALANTLNELALDDPARFEEAEELYGELLAVGKDFSGSWYLTTLFRYSSLLRFTEGRQDDADRYLGEFQKLQQTLSVPSRTDLDRGTFGSLEAPSRGALAAGPTLEGTPDSGVLDQRLASPTALEGVAGLRAFQLRDDAKSADVDTLVQRIPTTPDAVLAWGPGGVRILELEGGAFAVEQVTARPSPFAVALDLDAEERAFGVELGPTEVLSADGPRLLLHENVANAWVERELWTAPGAIAEAVPVDYDHEGDLDLLVVGAFGARLLRNDGAGSADGSFTDATEVAGLPGNVALAWATVEDLDSDQDVDLFFGGSGRTFWFDNERGGAFADLSASLPSDLARGGRLWVADFDGDGVVDVASASGNTIHYGDGFGGWARTPGLLEPIDGTTEFEPTPLEHTRRIVSNGAIGWASYKLSGRERAGELVGTGTTVEGTTLTYADLDGDRVPEVVAAGPAGVDRWERAGGPNVLRLWLAGEKDNRRGVGAIVEVRSGPAYRREFYRGRPLSLDVGDRPTVDVVRITWPNGVIQTLVDLPTGTDLRIRQKEGLVGSCPFLYSWNGTTFEFLSDVLGITPLGLPMAPGMLVPPDHDEYVLVTGEQLVPKDGEYLLQFTEELREVTYLDRARLDVVDHPADVEVFPNERFTFPPFPEAHTHTVRDALAPVRATGSDGKDWTRELAATDETFAVPFEARSGALLGLATPHFLELAFDPAATRDATKLRLVLTGWFYWTDASVNMASAGHPAAEFVPPLLQVPDATAEGGWRTVEPPLGFPAGKLKTMVVDVSEHVDPADPRVRIFSTLRIYWDALRLAACDDDAELRVTRLEPTSAKLWARGFSAPSEEFSELGLEWFRWEDLEDEPRWNMHPGAYTRFGECEPLLHDVDDRYVILGSGDCLTLAFDASEAPPLPDGWRRDFLVYLDGWAKDRDPNSHEALFVEPLPFHGMSGYPYGADEAFPDTPEHRAWRAEWNTRPARRWIEPLVPAAAPLAHDPR